MRQKKLKRRNAPVNAFPQPTVLWLDDFALTGANCLFIFEKSPIEIVNSLFSNYKTIPIVIM